MPPPPSAAAGTYGPPQPAGRSRLPMLLAIGAAAAAVAVAGGALVLASFLGGGGSQPEDVVPANAIAFAKIDLDPAASQKLAVYRLAERFPTTQDRVTSEEGVKDQLLSALFESDGDVDYDRDIAPWIGDRVGVAALPGAGEEPDVLAVIAYTDRAGAESAMRRLQEDDDETFFAFSDAADYVLLGESQAVVDAAAKPEQVLADAPAWKDALAALDGDQIVTAWADLGAVWDALPRESVDDVAQEYGLPDGFDVAGKVVLGARAAKDHVELIGRTLDVRTPQLPSTSAGTGKGSDMVARLPADTVAAMSMTNLGAAMADLFDKVYADSGDDPLGILDAAEEVGVTLPGDLRALLGEETLAAVGKEGFAMRTRSADVDGAFRTASALLGAASEEEDVPMLRRLDDGIAVASTPEQLDAVSRNDGGLGASPAFRTAVPDSAGAGMLVYIDIAQAITLTEDMSGGSAAGDELPADVRKLESFGMTSSGDARNGTFRMRLTVRE